MCIWQYMEFTLRRRHWNIYSSPVDVHSKSNKTQILFRDLGNKSFNLDNNRGFFFPLFLFLLTKHENCTWAAQWQKKLPNHQGYSGSDKNASGLVRCSREHNEEFSCGGRLHRRLPARVEAGSRLTLLDWDKFYSQHSTICWTFELIILDNKIASA